MMRQNQITHDKKNVQKNSKKIQKKHIQNWKRS